MRLNDEYRLETVAGQSMLVNYGSDSVDLSKAFSISGPVAFLWERLAGKDFTTDMMATMLCEEYDVTFQKALEDTEVLVMEWKKWGLI